MKRFPAMLAAVALVLLAAGCATSDRVTLKSKNPSGGTSYYDEWKAKEPRDILINLVDLEKHPPFVQVTVKERMRNNRIKRQRVRFDGGQSRIIVDHQISGYFNPNENDKYLFTLESARAFLSKHWLKSSERDRIVWEESKKIYRYGRRGGWIHRARIGPKTCILGFVALLSRAKGAPSTYSGDIYDTGIFPRDCSGKRLLKDYEKFFNGVKLVPQGYNRD